MEKYKDLKIAFIHGRPTGHPTHAKYAKSVGSTFLYEDKYLRWQDLNAIKLRRYLSWIINAFFFPNLSKYDIILTECVRVPQLIQKKLGLLREDQKLIALMSDESLYFTASKKFPRLTQILMTQFWKSCDAIICIGDFQVELAKKILPVNHHEKIYKIFNGIPSKQLENLKSIQPNLNSNNITFIGNASSVWRTEYKGLDLMLKAISQCLDKIDLNFKIAGVIPEHIQHHLLQNISHQKKEKIHFLGKIDKLETLFSDSSLYLHTARGEAWGISIIEAAAAGIPTIISDKTGSKEVILQIDPTLIVQLNETKIANKILYYFSLTKEEKQKISDRSGKVLNNYTEEAAINHFKDIFYKAIDHLKSFK